MGCIGCCEEPPPTDCCICENGWAAADWSVSILGKTLSGTFSPASAPDPLEHPECSSRSGTDCVVDDPVVVGDCTSVGEWSDPDVISMIIPCPEGYDCGAGTPGSGFFEIGTSLCILECTQCICFDDMADTYPCGTSDQTSIGYETSFRGVDHWRAWHQERYHGTAEMLCCTDTSIQFRFTLKYQLSRIVASQSSIFTRYRSFEVACTWPTDAAVGVPTITYGSWVETYNTTNYPPCLPCNWSQNSYGGDCDTTVSDCDPPATVTETIEVTFRTIRDNVCTFFQATTLYPDCEIPFIEGTSEITVVTGTRGCGTAGGTYGEGACDIGPTSIVLEEVWISECYPCDTIPCSVTLQRVGATEDEVVEIVDTTTCDGCATLPVVSKTLPFEITMTVCGGSTLVAPV